MTRDTLQHFELHVLLAMLREENETYSVPLVLALGTTYRPIGVAGGSVHCLETAGTKGVRQLAAR